MSRYELLLLLHVSSAIIWLGAGFLVTVLVLGAERAGDRVKEAGHHQDIAWLAPRLFIPASLATLVFGVLLVIDGPWGFDQLWITLALLGWAASFFTGFLYFKPEGERIGALVQERGPGDPEADWRLRRLNIIDRAQVTLLFLVVVDMVLKPTGDDGAVLVVGAVIVLALIAVSLRAIARTGGGRASTGPSAGPGAGPSAAPAGGDSP